MQTYDVLIVGGGPAGSTLAYSLKNSGLKIGILDKQNFPRQKICAGWVTPEVMRVLNVDLDDYAKGRVLQKISGFKISQLGQKQVEATLRVGGGAHAGERALGVVPGVGERERVGAVDGAAPGRRWCPPRARPSRSPCR